MALWEEVHHCGALVGYEVSYVQAPSSTEENLFLAVSVELSALPAPRLPASCHASYHDNGLNLWNYKPAQIKCFILYLGHGVYDHIIGNPH